MKPFIEFLFWKKIQKPTNVSKHEWRCMSSHPFLKKEMVKSIPNGDWDWAMLSRKSWCQELIIVYPWKKWDWDFLSFHLPYSFIKSYPYYPWNLRMIWKRFAKPEDFKTKGVVNEWNRLSHDATFSFIFSHIHFPWNWKIVSRKIGLSLRDVLNFPQMNWDFLYIYKTSFFCSTDLVQTKILNLDYKALSQNPYCRPHIVTRHINKNWDWVQLSIHPGFDPKLVHQNEQLTQRWRWDRCLGNPRISFSFYEEIRRHILIPNHFSQLSQNHFYESTKMLPYQLSVLTRFLWSSFVKKRIMYKLKLILTLKKHMEKDIVHHILTSFV